MNGPISEKYECEKCGGAVRCEAEMYRRDFDGEIIGLVEGYSCVEDAHYGAIVEDADGAIHSIEGVVER